MDDTEDTEFDLSEILQDPEPIDRNIRSIRHYSGSSTKSTTNQNKRLAAMDQLAHRMADKAEDMELKNVMSDDELDDVEELVRLATWSSLTGMRLLTEEVIENNNNGSS